MKRTLIVLAAIAGSAAVSAFAAARTMWQRWGVDPLEATKPLAGDDLVADAAQSDTRGIDIAAPPSAVWPWLLQMGYGRAGWYSYDQIDMNHPSARRILPEFQTLAVGDVVPTDPGGGFEVRVMEPERALVLYIDRSLVQAQRGRGAETAAAPSGEELESASANVRATSAYLDRAMSGEFAASWAFVLEPEGEGTRLIERVRVTMEPGQSPSGRTMPIPDAARSLLGFGVFVMVRRQMLGIRDRVEGRPIRERRWRPASRRPAEGPAPAA
jgi:hypothetical protein